MSRRPNHFRNPAPAPIVVESADPGSARVVSLSEFQRLTGYTRKTVAGWIDEQGCPEVGNAGKGEARFVDIRAVFKWKEDLARKEERSKFEAAEGEHPADRMAGRLDMKTRKELAATRTAEVKLAREVKVLVHREPLEYGFSRALGVVRQAVMSIPERITREMGGYPDEEVRRWRLQALDQCRAALEEGARTLNATMSAFADAVEDVSPFEGMDEAVDDAS